MRQKMISRAATTPQLAVIRAAALLLLAACTFAGCGESPVAAVTPSPSPTAREAILGKVIRFGTGGGSEQYRTAGWSKTEEKFTWSQGKSAKLELPVGAGAGALELELAMAAYIKPPELPTQLVELYANGAKVAEWEVGETAEFSAVIPASAAAGKTELELEFRTPKAVSPKAAGGADDSRVLGVALHHLKVTRSES
jgi:hypothetical protein